MKISYISNSRIPTEKAHGIQIIKMCEAFAENGGEVELVLPTRKNKPFKGTNIFDYYGVVENFKIKKLLSHDPTELMFLPNGVYIKFQIFFFIVSLFFFLLFKKNKKDYVFYTRDEYLLPLLLKFSKKVVWEAHTLPQNRRHYLRFWRKCTGIVAITKGLKKDLVESGLEENKIIVAPDGVDLEEFEKKKNISNIKEELNLPTNKKIVMYTGHFYGWKGVQTLADVFQYLDLSDISRVVFVGGVHHDIEKIKEYTKNSTNITFIPHQRHEKIPACLSEADILILPNSKNDDKSYWTSPLKMFEYMASGKPIIASDLPSIREILNENNATFFKPDDPKDLAEKIKDVLNNSELAERKAGQAKEDVKKYTWQKRVEKIIDFIKEV